MNAVLIREERPADIERVGDITRQAFAGKVYSDGSEPRIIELLRSRGDLALSLVAESAGTIVGHIAISPVTVSDGTENWFGLGPVSVLPRCQAQGIGARLIEEAIARMRERGAKGIVLLGDPACYGRFGFEHDPALRYPGPPSQYFQRLVLSGNPPTGEVRYAAAFG